MKKIGKNLGLIMSAKGGSLSYGHPGYHEVETSHADAIFHEIGHNLFVSKAGRHSWESTNRDSEWNTYRLGTLFGTSMRNDPGYRTRQTERYARLLEEYVHRNATLKRSAPGLYAKLESLLHEHIPYVALMQETKHAAVANGGYSGQKMEEYIKEHFANINKSRRVQHVAHILRKSKQKHHRNSSIHQIQKTGTVYQAKSTMATVNVSDAPQYRQGDATDLAMLYRHIETTSKGGRINRGIIFSQVSRKAIKDIHQATKLNVRGYRHAANTDGFVHIHNRHGLGNAAAEEIPITAEDIYKIPDIVDNYDKIEAGRSENGLPTIKYTKKYNDITYYIEEVQPAGSTKLLVAKSMYKHAG
jgi:hypothetical protein